MSLEVLVPEYIHDGDTSIVTCMFDADIAQLEWQVSEYDQGSAGAKSLAIYVPSTSTWTDFTEGRMTGDIDGMSSILTIHSVDWQMDDGRYWCSAYSADFAVRGFADGNITVSGKFRTCLGLSI